MSSVQRPQIPKGSRNLPFPGYPNPFLCIDCHFCVLPSTWIHFSDLIQFPAKPSVGRTSHCFGNLGVQVAPGLLQAKVVWRTDPPGLAALSFSLPLLCVEVGRSDGVTAVPSTFPISTPQDLPRWDAAVSGVSQRARLQETDVGSVTSNTPSNLSPLLAR